jgi:hypothetical protein
MTVNSFVEAQTTSVWTDHPVSLAGATMRQCAFCDANPHPKQPFM